MRLLAGSVWDPSLAADRVHDFSDAPVRAELLVLLVKHPVGGSRRRIGFVFQEACCPVSHGAFGVAADDSRGDGTMDGGTDRGRMVNLRHENLSPEHVRHQLHQQRVLLRESAGQQDPVERRASGAQMLNDAARAKAQRLKQRAIEASGGRPEIQADEQAAQ
jgi:hypothetical protein